MFHLKKVQIANQCVGEDESVFIVVETGTTCNGDLNTALRLVDAAKDAGADAIKFMIIGPDYFMSDRAVEYEYEWAGGHKSENMYQMFKGLEFNLDDWIRIRDYCLEKEIVFYATVDYMLGVDLAEELGVVAYKLSSWDTANFPLVRRMAQTGKPILVDTGPVTISDLEKLMNIIGQEGNRQTILVHCSHAKARDGINVRSVPYMQQVFRVPVGYSSDDRDFIPDLAAIALGAHLIEKRLTLDRSYPGHHHIKALEPSEFKEYVHMIRCTEEVLGEYAIRPSVEDLEQKKRYFVSIVANIDIPSGTTITREQLACKRPGTGIPPEFLDLIVGRKARRDIRCNELLSWDVI